MGHRKEWKSSIDDAVEYFGVSATDFWEFFDPDDDIVNSHGEVLTSIMTSSMLFVNSRDGLARAIISPHATQQNTFAALR